MSLEVGSRIPFKEVNYPIPEKNLILPCKGVWEFPLSTDPNYAEFNKWPSIITRYVVGRDYSGSQLPSGTREVLHVILLNINDPKESERHFVSYVDVSYGTVPNGIWDRFMRYDAGGYYAVFQELGNVGRLTFQGDYGIVRSQEELEEIELQEWREAAEKEFQRTMDMVMIRMVVRPKNEILLYPRFMPIRTEELPVIEEIYLAKEAELTSIFQS